MNLENTSWDQTWKLCESNETLHDLKLYLDHPLDPKVAHTQDSGWVTNWGIPVTCILLFLLWRPEALLLKPIHMWFPHRYRIEPIRSILLDRDLHRWLTASLESSVQLRTQCGNTRSNKVKVLQPFPKFRNRCGLSFLFHFLSLQQLKE